MEDDYPIPKEDDYPIPKEPPPSYSESQSQYAATQYYGMGQTTAYSNPMGKPVSVQPQSMYRGQTSYPPVRTVAVVVPPVQTVTVIDQGHPVGQPEVSVPNRSTLPDHPIEMTCNHCQSQITTIVEFENSCLTWSYCITLSAMGCILGCCLIPFCVDWTKDAVHLCPNCGHQLGKCDRMRHLRQGN